MLTMSATPEKDVMTDVALGRATSSDSSDISGLVRGACHPGRATTQRLLSNSLNPAYDVFSLGLCIGSFIAGDIGFL
jgi:hypothetical protein